MAKEGDIATEAKLLEGNELSVGFGPKQPIIKNGNVVAIPAVRQYRVYGERWWILFTVFLLNVANYAHWVAFPAVNKTAAKYYDQPGYRMDLIPTLSYGLGVPCSLLATYVVERFGLKYGLQVGGTLTGLGGLLCFLSSLPPMANSMPSEVKFNLALIGQALTGIACPFIACVPTKISQHWFADEQRTLATTLLGMSGSVGCILGQGLTPLMVYDPSSIAIMNTVWFVPAAVGSLLTMLKVHSNYPPLPPSPSATVVRKSKNLREWTRSVQTLFTNKAFITIFLFLGASMGCMSSLMTKMEQLLCSRGYSDQLAGLAGSLILASAAVASFPIGMVAYKTGKSSLVCKLFLFFGLGGVVGASYYMRHPDEGPGIIAGSIVTGAFAAGAYPVALELVVECTYPVDQATSTAFIFLSSALQGVVLMGMENVLNEPLDEQAMAIQTCSVPGDLGHQQPKDYSSYLNFIAIFMCSVVLMFIVFFKTEMKRTLADKLHDHPAPTTTTATSVNEDAEAFIKQPNASTS